LNDIKVLKPSMLTPTERKKILKVFDEISKTEFPSLWIQLTMNAKKKNFTKEEIKQLSDNFDDFNDFLEKGFEPRKKIDKLIFDVLKIPKERQDELFNSLYNDLLNEFCVLKNIG